MKIRLPVEQDFSDEQKSKRIYRGDLIRGKTYEEIYGEKKAKLIKEKLSKANKGNPKVINSLIGRPVNLETRSKMRSSQLGRHHTKETCKKVSENHADVSGEKNPMFNGWSSREPYGIDWSDKLRERAREKDFNMCHLCGLSQEESHIKLAIHHIDYNKKNNDINNLVTLCSSCHNKTNIRREFWVRLFKELQIRRKSIMNKEIKITLNRIGG